MNFLRLSTLPERAASTLDDGDDGGSGGLWKWYSLRVKRPLEAKK